MIDEQRLNKITEAIIGLAFKIHNVPGPGFAERVYENALMHAIRKMGLHVEQQVEIKVWNDGVCVGDFIADLVVEQTVLVENKAVRSIDDSASAQCSNYLACTSHTLCLPLNFGKKVEVKRFRGKQAA